MLHSPPKSPNLGDFEFRTPFSYSPKGFNWGAGGRVQGC